MAMDRFADGPINLVIPLLANIATATAINYKQFASGQIFLPTTSGLTTLTWYCSADGTTFYPLYQDTTGTAAAVTSSVKSGGACAVPIPIAALGCSWLKIVANVAATGSCTVKE